MLGETAMGALAEYCVVHPSQLIALPDEVSDIEAACLPVAYGTAHRMLLTRGNLQPDETVLVLGASGGVGTACILLAKMLGATVIAAASSPAKCDRLRRLGADDTIDTSAVEVHDYVRRTTGSLFAGGGCDVVVNFTGGPTWASSLRCVKRGGRLLTCGATAGFDPPTDLRFLWTGELNVLGSNGWTRDDLNAVVGLVARKHLTPVIDSVVPLSDGIEACRRLEEREVFGKVVVVP